MQKKDITMWDIVMETMTAMAVLIFTGLQIYYRVLYETTLGVVVYHMLPMLLIYVGMLILQYFPELLNGWNSEPLVGNVRIYAVRMVRMCKLFLVFGLLIPSIGDVLGMEIHAGYSLAVMLCILATIGYYLYRIFKYNSSQNPKER